MTDANASGFPAFGQPLPTPEQHGVCAIHPIERATFVCARCGNFGCAACHFSTLEGASTCTACAAQGLGEPIPWERRKQLGWWRAFLDTSRLASRQPERFFRTPATESGLGGPMTYAVAAYTFGQLIYMIQLAIVFGLVGLGAAAAGEHEAGGLFGIYSGAFGLCGLPMVVIQAPLYAVMGALLAASLSHGTLVLLKKNQGTFEQTFRAIAYANAPYFYYWIPCVGPLVAFVWMLMTEAQALRAVHRVSSDRAWIAILGYRILLLAMIVFVYAGLIGVALITSLPSHD